MTLYQVVSYFVSRNMGSIFPYIPDVQICPYVVSVKWAELNDEEREMVRALFYREGNFIRPNCSVCISHNKEDEDQVFKKSSIKIEG